MATESAVAEILWLLSAVCESQRAALNSDARWRLALPAVDVLLWSFPIPATTAALICILHQFHTRATCSEAHAVGPFRAWPVEWRKEADWLSAGSTGSESLRPSLNPGSSQTLLPGPGKSAFALLTRMVLKCYRVTSVACLHHPALFVSVLSVLLIQRQFKLKFACHGPPLQLPMWASLSVTGVEGRGGALRDHALVPVPVVLKRVKDVLGVGVDQVGPRLPQRVDDVVDEANLEKQTAMTSASRLMCFDMSVAKT
ncbi:hypothetical protein INR49_000281 [Caranx melampygus]|nr:hypothetical protein INR49_000281 [Caranx melampygus]